MSAVPRGSFRRLGVRAPQLRSCVPSGTPFLLPQLRGPGGALFGQCLRFSHAAVFHV